MRPETTADTATRLLDEAQVLVQERGYNAFSFNDLAVAVGIRKASIHHHFPTKADLGAALMARYHDGLDRALEQIERRARTASGRLRAFIALYRSTEARGAICLCGSLASDRDTLPDSLQDAVAAYIARSETWIASTIAAGVAAGEFAFTGRPDDLAATLVAGLQGGLIVARARRRGSVVGSVQREFFRTLRGS